jgi:hypothetical protein
MTTVLPVTAALPAPGDASSIGAAATGRSGLDAATLQFNLADLVRSTSPHPASPSAFAGEVIGNALKRYITRAHRHDEAQKAFNTQTAAAGDWSNHFETGLHRGPAYASLEPAQTETAQSAATAALDQVRAVNSATLEFMNFLVDTNLVVGTMTEANRSFNTLLKAQ